MSFVWNTYGHEPAKQILARQLDGGKMPHAYLFSGPSGIGKKMLAMEFAGRVLKLETENLLACPDFLLFDQEEEIKVEQLRDFVSRLNYKPLLGRYKVAIVNNADLMNTQSGNALLKTLEEPPENTVIILVGNGKKMLPTIVSRCQVLPMQIFSRRQIGEFAIARGLKVPQEIINLSFGCPGELCRLAGSEAYSQSRLEQYRQWQEVKKKNPAERFLGIRDLADRENGELRSLFLTWMYAEREELANSSQPKWQTVQALSQALEALENNFNKKNILQGLFLKI